MEEQLIDADDISTEETHVDESIQDQELNAENGEVGDDERIPKLGMVFKTLEDAYDFYKEYARCTGFAVVKRDKRCDDDGQFLSATFACCKQGKSRARSETPLHRLRPTKKTECKAKIIVRLRPDEWYHLEYMVLDHNHPVSPAMSRFYKSNRRLSKHAKKHLEYTHRSELPPDDPLQTLVVQEDGCEDLSYSACNDIDKESHLTLGEGDMEALLQFFMRNQKQNPNFFHTIDLDVKGRLRNVFWADARSKAAFQYFTDVISFDVIHMKNDLPFGIFVGANHHGHPVLLGCGLLAKETIGDYVWLFKALLACNSGHPPNAIITDHCKVKKGAVAKVFPGVHHRLCLFHTMKKFSEICAELRDHNVIEEKLCKVVYDSLRLDEFEEEWRKMIKEYELEENLGFRSLYEDRRHWVPVFVKDSFWAGLSTMERNESVEPFFHGYLTSKTSLKLFLQRYDGALKSKYEREAQEDYQSFNENPLLLSELKMEEQLSGIYTRNIFQKFQVELKQLIHVCASPVKVDDPFTTYEVKEYGKEKQGKYEVLFNAVEQDVQCICRSFESRGILCRHALCVLKYEGLIEIPSKYIVNRWKKDFKRLHALSSPLADSPVERGDNLYTHCMSQIADIVKIGSISNDRYEFVLRVMSEAKEKILEFDSSHGETSSGDRNIVVAKDTFGSYGVGKVSDPASVHHESHLPSKRKGLLLEKTKHQSRKGLVVSQHDVPPIGLSTHFGSHISPRERFNLMEQSNSSPSSIFSLVGFQVDHHLNSSENRVMNAINYQEM